MPNPIKFKTLEKFCVSCGEDVSKYALLDNGNRVKFDFTSRIESLDPGYGCVFLGKGVIYSLGNYRVQSKVKRYFWRKSHDRSTDSKK